MAEARGSDDSAGHKNKEYSKIGNKVLQKSKPKVSDSTGYMFFVNL